MLRSSLVSASFTRFSSASVADFAIRLFRSSMKSISAFLIVSSVTFFPSVTTPIIWLICTKCASFLSVLQFFRSTIGRLSPRMIWLSPSLYGSFDCSSCNCSSIGICSCSSLFACRGWYPPPSLFARCINCPSISAISSLLLLFGRDGTKIVRWAFWSYLLLIVLGLAISSLLSTNLRVSGLFSLLCIICIISAVAPQ